MFTTQIKITIIVSLIIGGTAYTGYVYHKGVVNTERKIAAKELSKRQELQTKYDKVITDYNTLSVQYSKKSQGYTTTTTRLINENKDYYSGECFNAVSLQHIRNIQQGTDTSTTVK